MFTYDHNQSLGYLTGLVSRLLSNRLSARFHEAGLNITPEQWGAILLLLNDVATTQGELVQQLDLDKSSVSRLVNGLEKRGLIKRERDDYDSRKKHVYATPQAKEIATKCEPIARAVLAEAQAGMSDEEVNLYKSLVMRSIKNLRKFT